MKILTDEMIDILTDAMDTYVEARDTNIVRYADRLFATLDTVLSIAEVRDGTTGTEE